jgi:hypothetical protein
VTVFRLTAVDGFVAQWATCQAGTIVSSVRVDVSPAAADYIAIHGGQVWVWASHPRMCCAGAPAWMHAAVAAPAGVTGFRQLSADAVPGLSIYFRAVGGQQPDVLEIGVGGRRISKVVAYWDGCLMAMTG